MDLPIKAITKARGKTITARLKNGTEYTGRLESADTYMNLILLDVEETVNDSKRKYPKALVRGNNLFFIQIQ